MFSGTDDKNQERVRAASLMNTWVAAVPCCQSPISQTSAVVVMERSRRSVQRLRKAGRWPASDTPSMACYADTDNTTDTDNTCLPEMGPPWWSKAPGSHCHFPENLNMAIGPIFFWTSRRW